MFVEFLLALFAMGIFIGGIICIAVGIDAGNHGAPVAGAILMCLAVYIGRSVEREDA